MGASGGTRPGAQALGALSTLLQSFKNAFFLDQNMLKMRIFWKKIYKIASAPGDPTPNLRFPPAAGVSALRSQCYYYCLLLQHFYVRF